MRGEFKVPGGKLVAVDVETRDGTIIEAFVSGDFFLEPDEALEVINAALVGQPSTASVAGHAEAINARHSPQVRMIGVTPV